MNHKILLVDDDPSILTVIGELIQTCAGVDVETCEIPQAAITLVQQNRYALVIVDYRMPSMTGLEFFRKVKENNPHQPVVIMSGCGSKDVVEMTLAEGVFDFISKPPEIKQVCAIIQRVLTLYENAPPNLANNPPPNTASANQRLIGRSLAMKKAIGLVDQAACMDGPVLFTGEHGTGKSLAARMIHKLSGRSGKKLISLEWSSVPESFFIKELPGDCTGTTLSSAISLTQLLNAAEGGTVVIDEIAHMSPSVQDQFISLIRQEPSGLVSGNNRKNGGVRIVATTTLDYTALASQRYFSHELFDYLRSLVISLPPLRNCRSDIPLLAHHFLKTSASLLNKRIDSISHAALRILMDHDWPGNVRELENVIERATALCASGLIEPEDILFSGITRKKRIYSAGISRLTSPYHEQTAGK